MVGQLSQEGLPQQDGPGRMTVGYFFWIVLEDDQGCGGEVGLQGGEYSLNLPLLLCSWLTVNLSEGFHYYLTDQVDQI